ncbi:phage tail protein [Mixta calida]|uniref:phage tail protein n=1 Tax=Mixta calida TaxID=665913 RepID=UPI0028A01F4C|nr:phage tail protein [Mixta calida]MDU5828128.1 phage tail protein [Mixta calida]
MADEPQKVIVQSSRIDASILPPGFSVAYKLYVIQQTTDLKNISDATNNANDLAYEATVKNQEQDGVLSDHSVRIKLAEDKLTNHETRISNAEAAIVSIDGRVSTAESDIDYLQDHVVTAEQKITQLQGDYVSKSATTSQTLAAPLNITNTLSVNGTQVVGARVTGFTTATGTALKGAFNADTTYTVGTTYAQSQVQAIANDLRAARQRIKALEDAMRAHGLIN